LHYTTQRTANCYALINAGNLTPPVMGMQLISLTKVVHNRFLEFFSKAAKNAREGKPAGLVNELAQEVLSWLYPCCKMVLNRQLAFIC